MGDITKRLMIVNQELETELKDCEPFSLLAARRCYECTWGPSALRPNVVLQGAQGGLDIQKDRFGTGQLATLYGQIQNPLQTESTLISFLGRFSMEYTGKFNSKIIIYFSVTASLRLLREIHEISG